MSSHVQEPQIVQKANKKYTPSTFKLNFRQREFKERAHASSRLEKRDVVKSNHRRKRFHKFILRSDLLWCNKFLQPPRLFYRSMLLHLQSILDSGANKCGARSNGTEQPTHRGAPCVYAFSCVYAGCGRFFMAAPHG